MDLFIDPDDQEATRLYACYTKQINGNDTVTAVFTAILEGQNLTQLRPVYQSHPAIDSGNHFGCRMVKKDHALYLTIGDRHARDLAQDWQKAVGAIIKIDLPKHYQQLDQHQFTSKIFTKGHRNPQGITLLQRNGEIWSVEHGPKGGDELNLIEAGKNYGWPIVSHGREYIGFKIGIGHSAPGYVDPIWVWTPSIAPSSLRYYDQSMFPALKHSFLVSALAGKALHVLKLDPHNRPISETKILQSKIGRIRDLLVHPDGSIFLINDEIKAGGLYRYYQ